MDLLDLAPRLGLLLRTLKVPPCKCPVCAVAVLPEPENPGLASMMTLMKISSESSPWLWPRTLEERLLSVGSLVLVVLLRLLPPLAFAWGPLKRPDVLLLPEMDSAFTMLSTFVLFVRFPQPNSSGGTLSPRLSRDLLGGRGGVGGLLFSSLRSSLRSILRLFRFCFRPPLSLDDLRECAWVSSPDSGASPTWFESTGATKGTLSQEFTSPKLRSRIE